MSSTEIRITGAHEASYQLGEPMFVYEANALLGILDPVPVMNDGTRLHIEAFSPTQVVLDEQRHIGRLIFFEICAFVSEQFPQIQAISFSFARPIASLGGPAQQAAARAHALERIGVEDLQIVPMTSGLHVVSGTWPYSSRNYAALSVALEEQRAIYRAEPISRRVRRSGGIASAIRRLFG